MQKCLPRNSSVDRAHFLPSRILVLFSRAPRHPFAGSRCNREIAGALHPVRNYALPRPSVARCVSPAAYVHPGESLEVAEGTVECFLSGQYHLGERGCGSRGGRSGSIPDSIPVTSLEGKLEGERKTPGRIASGRDGGWYSRDFPGVPATYRSPLSDGAATAVAAAAAADAPTCETTCSRRGSRSGGGFAPHRFPHSPLSHAGVFFEKYWSIATFVAENRRGREVRATRLVDKSRWHSLGRYIWGRKPPGPRECNPLAPVVGGGASAAAAAAAAVATSCIPLPRPVKRRVGDGRSWSWWCASSLKFVPPLNVCWRTIDRDPRKGPLPDPSSLLARLIATITGKLFVPTILIVVPLRHSAKQRAASVLSLLSDSYCWFLWHEKVAPHIRDVCPSDVRDQMG